MAEYSSKSLPLKYILYGVVTGSPIVNGTPQKMFRLTEKYRDLDFNSVDPTTYVQMVLPECEAIFALVQDARGEVANITSNSFNVLRPPSVDNAWLPEIENAKRLFEDEP